MIWNGIAGIKGLTLDVTKSWMGTWAPRIMQLKNDGQNSVRTHILSDYDHENPGMYTSNFLFIFLVTSICNAI